MGPLKKQGSDRRKMDGEKEGSGPQTRLLASIERFISQLQDRLESPHGKLMDAKESRLYGNVVMKSYSLWMKALVMERRDRGLEERFRKLSRQIPENTGKADERPDRRE